VNTERSGVMAKRSPRRREAAQALVEFTLIAPLLFLTFFGVIEFSLILASLGTYNFATNDAARLGSFLGRTDPTVDSQIVGVVRAHVQGIVMAKTVEIDIYRAASDGSCLTAPTGPATSTTVDDPTCVKNQYYLDGTVVTGTTPQWLVDARNDSLTDADYLGVHVAYQYTYLTSFIASIGSYLNLSATSAQRIEPQDFEGRLRSTHEARVSNPASPEWLGTSIAGRAKSLYTHMP
jgi:Flp pilus assembly protein TadG